MALGLGTIIRHTAGAIAAFVGVVLVLPLIVQALPTSIVHAVTRYLPEAVGLSILSTNTPPIFNPWAGLALVAGYAVVALAFGAWLMVKRDA